MRILACLLGISAACAGTRPPPQDASDRPLPIELRLSFSLGREGGSQLATAQLLPHQIAVDERSRLYVLAADSGYVAVFDSTGRPRGRVGRLGSGPGELAGANDFAIAEAGGVWVFDFTKRALVPFDSMGRVLPEVSMRGRGSVQQLAASNGQITYSFTRGDSIILGRLGSDTGFIRLAAAGLTPPRPLDARKCGLLGYERTPVFSPELLWTARRGWIAFVSDGGFTIQVLEDGEASRSLTRNARLTPSTHALAARALGPGIRTQIVGRPACVIPAEEVIRAVSFARTIPAYEALVAAPNGRLWAVRTTLPGDPYRADVYDLADGYLGTAEFGTRQPVAFLADGRLVTLERDADDIASIVVYEISVAADTGIEGPP